MAISINEDGALKEISSKGLNISLLMDQVSYRVPNDGVSSRNITKWDCSFGRSEYFSNSRFPVSDLYTIGNTVSASGLKENTVLMRFTRAIPRQDVACMITFTSTGGQVQNSSGSVVGAISSPVLSREICTFRPAVNTYFSCYSRITPPKMTTQSYSNGGLAGGAVQGAATVLSDNSIQFEYKVWTTIPTMVPSSLTSDYVNATYYYYTFYHFLFYYA